MESDPPKYPREIQQPSRKYTRERSGAKNHVFTNSYTDTKDGILLVEKISKELKYYNRSAVIRKAIREFAMKHGIDFEE